MFSDRPSRSEVDSESRDNEAGLSEWAREIRRYDWGGDWSVTVAWRGNGVLSFFSFTRRLTGIVVSDNELKGSSEGG